MNPILLATGDPTPISEFLGNVGTFLTQSISWCGSLLNTVVSNPPLLILCLAIPISGFAIGMLGRLKNL